VSGPYRTDGNAQETYAEALRALADPDFPADLRPKLQAAVDNFDRDRDKAIDFFRAGNAGPGTQEWADYHERWVR